MLFMLNLKQHPAQTECRNASIKQDPQQPLPYVCFFASVDPLSNHTNNMVLETGFLIIISKPQWLSLF